ncbi:hypothetical protein BC834DRAFT_871170 [Gloeopeniophorella convolvens]|nr:hypothetical protein BC834DRAFT_871170 [Gloeopeniophorella convolvens]
MGDNIITVHALSHAPERHTQQSDRASTTIGDDATFLSEGRLLVRAGFGKAGWQTPARQHPRRYASENAFLYAPAPPLVSRSRVSVTSVEVWGAPPLEIEVFSTAGLEPFEHTRSRAVTSLHSISACDASAVAAIGSSRAAFIGSLEPPAKRIKLDMEPLEELIPLPHYIPASPSITPSAVNEALAGLRSPILPVPPHTIESVERVFSSIYSRVAWFIPVRGSARWRYASRAVVAEDGSLPGSSAEGGIVWTRCSLRQFWDYLVSCSNNPDAGTGPFSLSFTTAPRQPSRSNQESPAPAMPVRLSSGGAAQATTSDPSSPTPVVGGLETRLTQMDYIKVYCAAPRAMKVRRALGEFVSGADGATGAFETPAGGVRVLEKARLVLVDGKGEGLVVS